MTPSFPRSFSRLAAAAFLVTTVLSAPACRRSGATGAETSPPLQPAPSRGAAGDTNLRVMVAEVVSSHACKMLRGRFQGLRAAGRPDVVTGVLWLRECTSSSDGTQVTLHLTGHGWQWVEETKHTAGAGFGVRQYVRFAMSANVSGQVDIGYDRASHVASMWFSPDTKAVVRFRPIGGVDVKSEDAWSSVVGAVSSLVASSPGDRAETQATSQGTVEMQKQFAQGISLTVDLCSGLSRTGPGHSARGEMKPPGVGESQRVSVALEPGGVIMIGPENAPGAMTANVAVSSGAVRVELVCDQDAQELARAFIEKREPPAVRVLAWQDVRDQATIRAASPGCPVTLVARPLPLGDRKATALFSWQRPLAEAGSAAGGPVIDCAE